MGKYIKAFLYVMILLVSTTLFTFANEPTLTDEISIRVSEPYGLRAVASVEKSVAVDEKTTEYGFVATRLVLMQMYGVKIEDFGVDSNVPKKIGVAMGVVDGENVDNYFEITENEKKYGGYFHGINKYNYLDLIVLRPYLVYDGEYGYGDVLVTSLYDEARKVYDSPYFDEIGQEGKRVITEIVEYSEDSFSPSADDLRIVLSVIPVQNENGYYNNFYTVLDPCDGSIKEVCGNRDFVEISDVRAFAKVGSIVALEGRKIEDRLCNSVVGELSDGEEMWITECTEDGKITLVPSDNTLSCKNCRETYVKKAQTTLFEVQNNSQISVITKAKSRDDLEYASVRTVSVDDIADKEKDLLCYYEDTEETLYADYVKAILLKDADGKESFLVVVVNDNENSAREEKCETHKLEEILLEGLVQLKKLRLSGKANEARNAVTKTISAVLSEISEGILVDNDYINQKYKTEIDRAKTIVKDEMDSTARTNFLNSIKNNVSKPVQDFLIEYFDIDTSKI